MRFSFLRSIVESRTPPVNIIKEDIYIFKHEYKIKQPEAFYSKFSNLNYYRGFLFSKNKEIISGFNNVIEMTLRSYLNQIRYDNGKIKFNFESFIEIILKGKNKYLTLINLLIKYYIDVSWKFLIKIFYRTKINFFKPIYIESAIWIGDNWKWANYFHWMTDFLPKILLFRKNVDKDFFLLIPISFTEKSAFYVLQSLNLLNIKYIVLNRHISYRFKEIYVLPNMTIVGNQRVNALQILRNEIKAKSSLLDIENEDIIYISRSDNNKKKYNSNIRNIINEKECINMFNELGIKTVALAGVSLDKQIKIFEKAKLVIGLHGAGLTNMLYCKTNSYILEIRQEGDYCNNCYFSLASALEHRYYYFKALNLTNNSIHSGSIYVETDKLRNLIVEIINNF